MLLRLQVMKLVTVIMMTQKAAIMAAINMMLMLAGMPFPWIEFEHVAELAVLAAV